MLRAGVGDLALDTEGEEIHGGTGGGPPLRARRWWGARRDPWTGSLMKTFTGRSSTGSVDGELDEDLHGELDGAVDGELARDLHGEELDGHEWGARRIPSRKAR
jgi:hypothetical protein